uniref:Ig-like domain-containing protein n=1 Tax=Myripristis murdjan TaxID=586833 RepID=A0A667X0X7_9TELE
MKHWLTNILILTLWKGNLKPEHFFFFHYSSSFIHFLLCMLCSSPECKGEDRVIQHGGDVIATEGETLTLACTFETTDSNPYLFWYKQEVNGFPKFMMRRYTFATEYNAEEFPKEKFDAQIINTSVPLKIQKLQPSDSALYHCAVKPTSLYKNLTDTEKMTCRGVAAPQMNPTSCSVHMECLLNRRFLITQKWSVVQSVENDNFSKVNLLSTRTQQIPACFPSQNMS